MPPHSEQHAPYQSLADAPRDDEETGLGDDGLTAVHVASVEEKKRLWWRNALINMLFIAAWFFFATVLSVYNKWMFSPEYYGFPFPLFVTTFHMFVQFGLAAILRYALPTKFRPDRNPNLLDYSRKVVPTGAATGLDIGLSNLSLKMITLSFYTMVKSSSLVFVLLFAFLFRLELFSYRLVGVIVLIVCGVLLMVATETHFVLSGFLLVLSGSALGGLRWSLTQLLLKNRNLGLDNPAATLFWLAPIMGFTLVIVSFFADHWSDLVGGPFFSSPAVAAKTCFFLTAPGVLAFFMVMSEYYILQRAGVVPMSIAGIAKEVTTISVSAWFFGDQLSPLNITGAAITVCGICLFTYHKYRKSIESTVPLDAHGNPVTVDDALRDDGPYERRSIEEMQPLAEIHPESRHPTDETEEPLSAHREDDDVLFDLSADDIDAKSLSSQYVREEARRISYDHDGGRPWS
ncbi:triose-phosphate transporter family-domain-containing protein [Cristinia sonorae]|uniref:Triose-phosphate transporter family-domain-containing protein n=1 Tax=Cristinia sonorae TaxID=1940300 RepID=A0A8K0V004_9AGAR|nr:triose-phosphate transporter family-domain-containing protein [Cristinia sonorae]